MNQAAEGIRSISATVERIQTGERAVGRETENGAVAASFAAAQKCRSIEIAIAARRQRRVGVRSTGAAERMQAGQRAVGCDSEHRAVTIGAAVLCGTVEIPADVPHQRRCGRVSISTASERMQTGQRAVGRDLEHGALTI